MRDEDRTKEGLIAELNRMRRQIADMMENELERALRYKHPLSKIAVEMVSY